MFLKHWLETLGHGYRKEVTEGGDGGGGQAVVEEDGIDTVETTASNPEYEEYDIVDPIYEERAEAADTVPDEEETTETPVKDEQSPPEAEVDSTPAVEAPASATAEFPPELLEQAGQLNFKYEDVKAFGTPEALQVAVNHKLALLREAVEYAKGFQPAPAPDTSVNDEMEKRLAALREEGFDEDMISVQSDLLKQNQAMAQQIQEMQNASVTQRQEVEQHAQRLHEQLQQQQIQSESKALVGWFDKQLEALPESYQEVLGTGSTYDISPGSPEYVARDKVMRAVNNFQSDWQRWGFASDNDPKLFQAALSTSMGDHTKTMARDELKSKMRRNGQQVTTRPTHATSQPLDGRERAAANADKHALFNRG
mgnify:CR=1 FL=1